MKNNKGINLRRGMSKKLTLILAALSMCIVITGCSKDSTTDTASDTDTSTSITLSSDNKENVSEADTFIDLNNGVSVTGSGATVDGNKITISKGGTYSVSGTISDGQIIVNASDTDKVYIILNGVNITCSDSSPIYVVNADKTVISLEDGTENTVTDTANYVFEDETTDEPNAAIFSKDDLVITGTGSLTVNGNYNDGITSKDDLKIENGNITVNSIDDGIRGKDSVEIYGGTITINAEGDGIRSNNTEDTTKGYVYIEDGTINITSGTDGIQASTEVLVEGGTVNIVSGGGSANSSTTTDGGMNGDWGNWGMPGNKGQGATTTTDETTTEEESTSAKGIKATSNIVINDSTINIDSSDDAIHSNHTLTINGGNITISSGDDGIHSDTTLDVNGGTINITKSYEGIESTIINLNGGDISVVSSDDGINASGGNDASATGGRPGQNSFSSGTGQININGGNISVNASGDGIDANGSITMTDGVVVVNGPTNSGNGSLDYDGSFNIKGGTLIAAGSLGMAQAPSSSSTQNSVSLGLSQLSAGTVVNIESSDGNNILTFEVSKVCQSIVISSSNLETGKTYSVSIGGTSTGTENNGIYLGGNYSGGTKVLEFTVSGTITNANESGVTSSSNMQGGRGGGGAMGMPGIKGDAPTE